MIYRCRDSHIEYDQPFSLVIERNFASPSPHRVHVRTMYTYRFVCRPMSWRPFSLSGMLTTSSRTVSRPHPLLRLQALVRTRHATSLDYEGGDAARAHRIRRKNIHPPWLETQNSVEVADSMHRKCRGCLVHKLGSGHPICMGRIEVRVSPDPGQISSGKR